MVCAARLAKFPNLSHRTIEDSPHPRYLPVWLGNNIDATNKLVNYLRSLILSLRDSQDGVLLSYRVPFSPLHRLSDVGVEGP